MNTIKNVKNYLIKNKLPIFFRLVAVSSQGTVFFNYKNIFNKNNANTEILVKRILVVLFHYIAVSSQGTATDKQIDRRPLRRDCDEAGEIYFMKKPKSQNNQIALFKGKKIRKIMYNKEWYFSVIDIIAILTDSPTPRQYWSKVKQREFIDLQLSPIWVQLKLESSDGKKYKTDCANTEDMLRIIQSIPSPKAEPLKRWLAKVGYERIQEIENPELATKRTKILYKLKVILKIGLKKECGESLFARN